MNEQHKVVMHLRARAEGYKARGRLAAALGAIFAALYAGLMAAVEVFVGEGPRPFGLPPATPEEVQTTALLAVGVGCATAVLRALVSLRAAGRRRELSALMGAAVIIVPLTLALYLKFPLLGSGQFISLFVTAACAFFGLFVQDQLTIKAEGLEDKANEQDRLLRLQELSAVEGENVRLRTEVKRLRAEVKYLRCRAARRRTGWGLRLGR